jgi:hypothetical protein
MSTSPFHETGYRLFPQFLSPAETERLRALVGERQEKLQAVAAKAKMNLAYHVVHGNELRQSFPDFFELAAGRLLELAQEQAGIPLELMRDPKRAVRIQHYRKQSEGFLWHLDGGEYGALLTLVNTNHGVTEVLSPRLSRWLKPVPYLLFPFQGVLARMRTTRIVANAGDLLILHGGKVIHRGLIQQDDGERTLLAVSYDRVGKKTSRVWEWIARRLNY